MLASFSSFITSKAWLISFSHLDSPHKLTLFSLAHINVMLSGNFLYLVNFHLQIHFLDGLVYFF